MVQICSLMALVALSVRASALVTRQVRGELKSTFGEPVARHDASLPLFKGVEPKYVHLKLEDLQAIPSNATAPPSDGVLAELAAKDTEKRAIINGESRKIAVNITYPYKTMGKVFWSNGGACTGVLVGPRHVATAKHCAKPGAGVTIRFVPFSFAGGEPFGGSQVSLVYFLTEFGDVGPNAPTCDYKEDWAIFILQDRLGDRPEYMGATTLETKYVGQPIYQNLGYPSDLNSTLYPYYQTNITIGGGNDFPCDQYGPLNTDADAATGQSGGPLWREGDGLVLGLMSAGGPTYTLFASGPNFFAAVVSTRQVFLNFYCVYLALGWYEVESGDTRFLWMQ